MTDDVELLDMALMSVYWGKETHLSEPVGLVVVCWAMSVHVAPSF